MPPPKEAASVTSAKIIRSGTIIVGIISGLGLLIATIVTGCFGLLKSTPPTTAITGTNIHKNITGSGNTVIDNSIKGDGNINGDGNTVNVDNRQTVIITTNTVEPFLEGTKFTKSQLDAAFPFGFVVIAQDGQLKQTRYSSDKLEWDVESSSLKADFSTGMAHLTAKFKIIGPFGNARDLKFENNEFDLTFPIEKGVCHRNSFIYASGQPLPFVGILSANQFKQVYVIGYRISARNQGRFIIGQ